jgi:hypothetical protein
MQPTHQACGLSLGIYMKLFNFSLSSFRIEQFLFIIILREEGGLEERRKFRI